MSTRVRISLLGLIGVLAALAIVMSQLVTSRAQQTGPVSATEIGYTPAAYMPLIVNDPTSLPEPTPLPTIQPSPAPTLSLAMTTVYGIETASIFRATDVLTQAGTSWTRRNALMWDAVEPTEGARNWSTAAALEAEFP